MNWSKVVRAAQQGLDKAAGRVPEEEVDPYFRAYQKMNPSDFAPLVTKFGEDKVISYIKEMEAIRIKNAGT